MIKNSILSEPKYLPLRGMVQDIAWFESEGCEPFLSSLRFFADGLPGLMYVQSDQPVILQPRNYRLPSFFWYGQTVAPIEVATAGSYRYIVFRLFPQGIRTLLGEDASQLTDECAPYQGFPIPGHPNLTEQLAETTATDNQIRLIADALLQRLQTPLFAADPRIAQALHTLSTWDHETDVMHRLHRDLYMSERAFQRKFREQVGISPRQYIQIVRFNAVYRKLLSGQFQNFSDLAFDHQYADQSHFIRMFKTYAGMTPTELLGWTTQRNLTSV
jgi:AraC-like DNA-binding protein